MALMAFCAEPLWIGFTPSPLFPAKVAAFVLFSALLTALCWALWRARKRLRHDEADAVIEQEFRRLEAETSQRADD